MNIKEKKSKLQPVAITQEIDSRNPKFVNIKLCYLVRHPESEHLKWYTRRDCSMFQTSIFVNDVIDILAKKYRVPILLNVKRGDTVSEFQKNILKNYGYTV